MKNNNKENTEKPLVGFFPAFFNIGETAPHVKIAKLYMEKGGKAIFFNHGGPYEYMAKDIGCEVVKLQYLYWNKVANKKKKIPTEEALFKVYKRETIDAFVEEEIEVLKENGVELVMSSFNPTCNISAKVLNIPHVALISGTAMPPYYKSGFATFPENYENVFTKILPSSLKNRITQWYLLNNKMLVRDFNKVAKKYHLKPFRCLTDILLGDHTFVCDDIQFLGVAPSKEFPLENFIGPIIGVNFGKEKELDVDIKNHLKKPGKSIFLTMGSYFDRQLFLKILETLNQTDYKIIVVCTTIVKKENLPEMNDNILVKQFVSSPMAVNKMVDLAITHGGRGTVYTAALSGKPAIGIPLHMEQQYNIDNLVRNGTAIRVSRKFFKSQDLLNAIDTIFSNYNKFLTNAQNLATRLSQADAGEKNAVKRLIEIIQEKNIYNDRKCG